ncbi:hypothetical protein [Streptomyces omiyaensis]
MSTEIEPEVTLAPVQPLIDPTAADGATLVALGVLEELPEPIPNEQ